MARTLTIITLPDNRLRLLSQPLTHADISHVRIQELCNDMIKTMYEDDGIGLAAPQIGENVRLIVIGKDALTDQKEMPFPLTDDLVLINPEIQMYSWKTNSDDEGCLSVPGLSGTVERHTEVTIAAENRTGQRITFVAKKYFARVLQHEIDHLNGVLFIDRAKEVWKHGREPSL